MEFVLGILAIIAVVALIVGIIKLLIKCARKNPTWKGIIISAILGLLPFYLILCFFGLMGEQKNRCNQV